MPEASKVKWSVGGFTIGSLYVHGRAGKVSASVVAQTDAPDWRRKAMTEVREKLLGI